MRHLAGLSEDIVALAAMAPDTISKVVSILRKIQPHLGTVKTIIDDPALPTVMERIRTLNEIQKAKPKVPGAPATAGAGIALKTFVLPLDAFIYTQRNPWAIWAFGAAFVLLVGGVGYKMGRKKGQTK